MGSIGTTTFPNGQTSTGIFYPGATIFNPSRLTPVQRHHQPGACTIAAVTDGTSNTVAFAEGVVGDLTHWTQFRDGVAWTAAGPYYAANDAWAQQSYVYEGHCGLCCDVEHQAKRRPKSEDKGWRWGNEATGDTLFNTIIPPSSTTYPWSGCRPDNSGGPVSNGEFENANSFHPGGCNVGFADGSVRFVKSSIAMMTWWALGTKAGGEIVSAISY